MEASEFYDTFFEEAGELLDEMEGLLVALDTSAPDVEALNAIFRAAHSIKGGAGTFGFEALQNTTHVMENLLDLARRGELQLDRPAVDCLLEASDVLKSQLEAYRGRDTPDADAAREICDRLTRIVVQKANGGVAATKANEDAAPSSEGRTIVVRVSGVKPGDANLLADELALFGDVSERQSSGPESLALTLHTSATDDDIVAVLCFIVDADQITIENEAAALDDSLCRITVRDIDEADGLSLLGALSVVGNVAGTPRLESGTWTVDLVSDQAIDDIAAVLSFEIDASRFHMETVTVPTCNAATSIDPDIRNIVSEVRGAAANTEPAANDVKLPWQGSEPEKQEKKSREQQAGAESASVRVPTEKIDHIINLVGELIITQSMLERAGGSHDRDQDHDAAEVLSAGLNQLAHNARDLQEAVMSMRMLPMDFVFNRFPRLVRDLGSKLGKEVNLVTEGGATELDKGLIERIMDPLTHLVRNSLDHGIEDATTRRAVGKPAAGQLTLSARHEGGNIVLEIKDDGAGLSRERILAKARSNGLPVSDDMADAEVWQLIFAPGFSTAEKISDVSGRGVGMDVVKRNISQLGGHVDLHAVQGAGTTVRVVLPLTLAIMDGMAIRAGGEVFILPVGMIRESLRIKASDVRTVGTGGQVIEVRGEYLRLIELHRVFDIPDARTDIDRGIVIVVSSEARRFALFVDELLGQQQIVVKNLETHFRKVAGVSAATILGDGSVALILDVAALGQTTKAAERLPTRPSIFNANHRETAESIAHG